MVSPVIYTVVAGTGLTVAIDTGSLTISGTVIASSSPDTLNNRKSRIMVKISIRETRLSPVSIANLYLCLFTRDGTYIIVRSEIFRGIAPSQRLLFLQLSYMLCLACSGLWHPFHQDTAV